MAQTTLSLRVKRSTFRGSPSTGPRPFQRVAEALKEPFGGGRGRQVVERVRTGKGGLSTQIDRRTHFDQQGGERAWQEPTVRGKRLKPDHRMESIFWRAALGKGSGSYEVIRDDRVQLGVRDIAVRREAAALGNKIVSTADYFPFVTGGFGTRTEPRRAYAVKPSRAGGFYQARFAMWWYIALTHGIWLTRAELQAGVLTPPKGLGLNPVMVQALTVFMLKAMVSDLPGGLGRGKA
jgi:hypothetical protein